MPKCAQLIPSVCASVRTGPRCGGFHCSDFYTVGRLPQRLLPIHQLHSEDSPLRGNFVPIHGPRMWRASPNKETWLWRGATRKYLISNETFLFIISEYTPCKNHKPCMLNTLCSLCRNMCQSVASRVKQICASLVHTDNMFFYVYVQCRLKV